MRIALAQLDSAAGDLAANGARTADAAAAARAAGADLVVFPELQRSGYTVSDGAAAEEVREAVAGLGGLAALVCFHERDGGHRYDSAAYADGGTLVHVQRKLYLVDYPPFDEHLRFAPGESLRAFDTALGRMAVLICNDAWQPFLPSLAVHDGAEILLVPAASSNVVAEAEAYWRELTRFYARMLECYVVFVNRVGTEAGFTFWGGSHVVDPVGDVVAEAPRLDEALLVADVELDRVAARRRELPLVGDLRADVLHAELARLLPVKA